MADQAFLPRSEYVKFTPLSDQLDQPWYSTVADNIRDALFPSKQPPLQLTSKPVRVRSIWGEYNYKKKAGVGSMMVHAAMIGALIWLSVYTPKVVEKPKTEEHITYIAPPDLDKQVYTPTVKVNEDKGGGGGGGGDRDKLQAPKGKLPKQAMQQLAPPAMVLRNDHPKLAVEPSVVIPPQMKLADNHMPNLGDPMSKLPSGPPSNGTGSGGGIGSGSGGGVGSGEGPGVGPGRGGGTGGGIFKVGGGVSAPRGVYTPDPEYSEEARKAKYQGTVILWLIVDPTGKPRDIKVARSLGMGLDEKAIEAVKAWKFDPARKDGAPVAVQINVEVNFRLY
jgi:periplasmic protein TonB